MARRRKLNPATMATNWTSGLKSSKATAAYEAAAKDPSVQIVAPAVAAKELWWEHLEAAHDDDAYAQGLEAAGDAKIKGQMLKVGSKNLRASADDKAGNAQDAFDILAPIVESELTELDRTPPTSDANRKQRMDEWYDMKDARKKAYRQRKYRGG